MDCSLPGSSVHGSFQARVLEWAASPSPGKQCTQRRKLMNRNLRARRPAGGALSPVSTAEPKPEEERPAPPSSPAGLSRFVYSFGCPPSFLYLPWKRSPVLALWWLPCGLLICTSPWIPNKPIFAGEVQSQQQSKEPLPSPRRYPATVPNLLCLHLEPFSKHSCTYSHLWIYTLLLAKMESLLLKLCSVFCRCFNIDFFFNSISQYEGVCLTILWLNDNRLFRTFHLYKQCFSTHLCSCICVQGGPVFL